MIQLSGITKEFPSPSGERLRVLDGVDLELAEGGSLAIQGPSGSGKSTLLGILAGLEQPTSGTVKILGVNLGELSERELAKFRARKQGFVFQAFHLLQHFSALQNVAIGAEIAGLKEPMRAAREALARVDLADRLDHLPGRAPLR
jgi:putative ABC transport system ATP-binding protein